MKVNNTKGNRGFSSEYVNSISVQMWKLNVCVCSDKDSMNIMTICKSQTKLQIPKKWTLLAKKSNHSIPQCTVML